MVNKFKKVKDKFKLIYIIRDMIDVVKNQNINNLNITLKNDVHCNKRYDENHITKVVPRIKRP